MPDEISKFTFTNKNYLKKATQESEEARKERAETEQNFRVMTIQIQMQSIAKS